MKMYAAALLALGTAAMQLSDDTEGHPVDGEGNRVLPHEAPTCPVPPSDEEAAAIFASPASFAATVDAANADKVADGKITEREAFNALYCMVVWGAMNKCDAFDAFDHFQETYGAGGEVSVIDAAADIEASMAEE